MSASGNSNEVIQGYYGDQVGDADETDVVGFDERMWNTLSFGLSSADDHDESSSAAAHDASSTATPLSPTWNGTNSPTRHRRFALGYSVLTQANARLACGEASAEQHWDRISAQSSYYQKAERKAAEPIRTTTEWEQGRGLVTHADPFPPLVSPRSSNFVAKTMTLISTMSPPPTPPLWSRPKRVRENDQVVGLAPNRDEEEDGNLDRSSSSLYPLPPLPQLSIHTPAASASESTPTATVAAAAAAAAAATTTLVTPLRASPKPAAVDSSTRSCWRKDDVGGGAHGDLVVPRL